MRKYRLRVGLDVDDTVYNCNEYALQIVNAKHPENPPFSVNDIRNWGEDVGYLAERVELYNDPEFVRTEPILPGAQEFVHKLCKIADVFFVTAVPPQCMSVRAQRLREDFPEVPVENIIMGTRKDVVAVDILLDDGGHNISNSRAPYPVLFRRPWNTYLSGLLSVNGYDEFLHLCEMILNSFTDAAPDLSRGGVLCLVGPTGSLKNEIAAELTAHPFFDRVLSTTTRPRRAKEDKDYRFITEEEFIRERDAGLYVETTVYSGHFFGITGTELEPTLSAGRVAVIPIDICGAVTFKTSYRDRAMLVFMNREKKEVLRDILRRSEAEDDKILRITSLDLEYRNAEICDVELKVGNDPREAAEKLIKMVLDGK